MLRICPIAAAACTSWPTTSPMTSIVAPVGCISASYQSPPTWADCAAGTYRTTICTWSGSGGGVSRDR